jgi:glycosyltransferase involved in cell wall biosynthesis
MSTHQSTQPVRVLFVLGTLWGENGITSHLKTLSKQFIKRGFQVAIASDLPSNVEGAYDKAIQAVESFKSDGVTYFFMSFARGSDIIRQPLKSFQTIQAFEQVIQSFKPDIIHCHSLSVVPYIHIARVRYKIPFVSTCHVEPSPSSLKASLIRLANRIFPSLFGEHFIAVSSELQSAFQESLGVSSKIIHLIFHGINDDYFHVPPDNERLNARETYNLSSTDKVVCLIGRLSPRKGHDILIKALSNLQKQGVVVTALFAGQGYEDEELEIRRCALEFGVLDSIRFLGMTDSRQVLWASDIIVLPSRPKTEAFGLVVAEAMLCGVIPIRTPAAGAFDQIDEGKNGFIVPFDDPDTLALRLNQILTNPDLQAQLAAAAVTKAQQKFTLANMAKSTIELYQEVISVRKN